MFAVDVNGTLREIELTRGIGGGCDDEALRLMEIMPNSTPGENERGLVTTWFTIPIYFKLQAYPATSEASAHNHNARINAQLSTICP
jgi:protein TonB